MTPEELKRRAQNYEEPAIDNPRRRLADAAEEIAESLNKIESWLRELVANSKKI
jgi:hypothetical protein